MPGPAGVRQACHPLSCHTCRAPRVTCRAEAYLGSRSGSSMRKSFALCEAFGLTPFPLSAGEPPPTQPSVAERPSAPCTALRAARCKCRYGRLRAGRISRRRGAFGPPPPSKPHPSPG